VHTKCTAYKDKRQNIANNEKTQSDFYSKSGAGLSFTTSSSGSTSGGGSWAGSGWSHPTVTGPSASTYGQPFFPGTWPTPTTRRTARPSQGPGEGLERFSRLLGSFRAPNRTDERRDHRPATTQSLRTTRIPSSRSPPYPIKQRRSEGEGEAGGTKTEVVAEEQKARAGEWGGVVQLTVPLTPAFSSV
jgi:hypothetical protein